MDIVWITLVVLALLNILVSILLVNRDDLEAFQKAAQIVIVWLVPFLGAMGVWWFHHSQDKNAIMPANRSFGGGAGGESSSYTSSGD